jgi:hypothetical protein
MMKTVSCLAVLLSAGFVACATGSTAPEDPTDTATDSDGGPIVLATPGEDAGTTSSGFPGTGNAGVSSGDGDDGGFGSPGADSGGSFGGGFDSGAFFSDDSGSSGLDSGSSGFSGFDSGSSGGDASGGATCEGYADPNTFAGCTCAASDQSECQSNGCYGGYWCDTITSKCHANPPSGC